MPTGRHVLNFWPLDCTRINLCCDKPLSLWRFVPAAIGDEHRGSGVACGPVRRKMLQGAGTGNQAVLLGTHAAQSSPSPSSTCGSKQPCEVRRATTPFMGGETEAQVKVTPCLRLHSLLVTDIFRCCPCPTKKHLQQPEGVLYPEHFTLYFWDPQEQGPAPRVHWGQREGKSSSCCSS